MKRPLTIAAAAALLAAPASAGGVAGDRVTIELRTTPAEGDASTIRFAVTLVESRTSKIRAVDGNTEYELELTAMERSEAGVLLHARIERDLRSGDTPDRIELQISGRVPPNRRTTLARVGHRGGEVVVTVALE